jgi:CheY-like chemotaxis protein
MDRILVVSPNRSAFRGLGMLLRSADCEVYEASEAAEAVRTAREVRPGATLIGDLVPGTSSRDLVESLRRHVPSMVCLVVDTLGGTGMPDATAAAAHDRTQVVPLTDALYAMRLLTSMRTKVVETELDEPDAHALDRWAEPIVRIIGTRSDPRTLAEWGRSVGVSLGTLRNWCRTARLSAHRSLLFARVLRAVVHHQASGSRAEDLLNIVDRRTLAKLLQACGSERLQLPPTIEDFLNGQRLIDNPAAVARVRAALSMMGCALTPEKTSAQEKTA